ncbi:AAA family ATPase [Rossellomorea marisflavi]|uniref:Shikimate kinase n=1 Tax=Rossellomorea marisflavi TaxID=189381 RepID=A0A165J553_9BACI|nr:AAA family ATPase [Rossellomorea marisflavi]KZE45329.1 shikimate kinase [Rossellomorea marisflavi]TYO72643.1 AAA family ATPase [Rossellomorea marisflavi]
MKLVIIIGPQAVGKMTVGQELAKITDLKLFHNHMTIDLVGNFFDYGSAEGKRLVKLFRHELFDAISKSDLKGLIFTFVWAFDMKEDWDYIESISMMFQSRGGSVYFVELEADVKERLKRNTSENRLNHKPSKRDVDWSERDLLDSMTAYRLNSFQGELNGDHYVRIDNSIMSAAETAEMIKHRFDL